MDVTRHGGGAGLAVDGAHGFARLGNDVERVGDRVNDRRGSDADFGNDVGVGVDVRHRQGGDAAAGEVHLPELGAIRRGGVEGVDAVGFGGNEDHVASGAAEIQVGDRERGGVD